MSKRDNSVIPPDVEGHIVIPRELDERNKIVNQRMFKIVMWTIALNFCFAFLGGMIGATVKTS